MMLKAHHKEFSSFWWKVDMYTRAICIAGSALLKEAQPVGGERHQGQPGALNGCLFDSKIK